MIVTDSPCRRTLSDPARHIARDGEYLLLLLRARTRRKHQKLGRARALTEWLIGEGVERGDHVIALGGGVIGDLVGFACSIVKRGCHFIQVPTTLLAQVDSSVGGKTAINVPAGKNLIGAFHQPALVVIDPTTLETLPRRELGAGYAEVVKYGLIDDAEFLRLVRSEWRRAARGRQREARHKAIAHSVAAKARIVAADERETQDIRALLNLGHSFGHALEAETGYSDRLLHGEAVAAGMVLAHQFSAANGLCPAADAARVRDHLASVDLPHSLASAGVNSDGADAGRRIWRTTRRFAAASCR
jgi:3-dehydroquinate synthase